MEKITVREAGMDDCEALCRLNRVLGYGFDLERTRERFASVLRKEGHKIFVAQRGGEIVGSLHANDYDLIYSEPMKNIMGIAVLEEARRLGVGRLLLHAAEDWAKRTGAAGIRLDSGFERTGAHAFYRACGYESRKDHKNFIKLF